MPHPIPVAIEALVALVVAQTLTGGSLVGVVVSDGEPIHGVDDPDAIGIALDVMDPSPVRSQVQPRGLGTEVEQFDIKCVAESYSGKSDDDVRVTLRRRAYALLDAVRAELLAHKQLGLPEQVLRAWISSSSYQHLDVENGFMAVVDFAVTVQAYRPRR